MAEMAMNRGEWCTRLAVGAQVIDDLLIGFWVEHDQECAAIAGGECSCGLLAMFSTYRTVVAVDDSLGVGIASRH